MIRKPVVAGKFYAHDFRELEIQIENSFLHKLGPGKLPENSRSKTYIKAVISPHAGYSFSGPCAAHAFLEIAESNFPDVFIIIGPNHSGLGGSSVSYDDYHTPFGVASTDREMAKDIFQATELVDDGQSHIMEHSVEVQIPFLQYACRDRINDIKIVPIVLSGEIDSERLGRELMEVIRKSRKKVVIIASSDMTHLGRNYGYVPFEHNIMENMYELDMSTIRLIQESNPGKFLNHLDKTGSTVCGKYPIAVLLNAISSDDISLLKYYTSGDIIGDYSNSVGYASIVFR